jgi:serine/threonine protein kinase
MNIIGNKYRLIEKLGQGCYGMIYLSINIRTGEKVAIKIESNNIKLLKNEVKVYKYLNNTEGIPRLYWFGSDKENSYMVMELLGCSLKTANVKKEMIRDIGIKMMNRVEYIHSKGLIHRDIKPENFVYGLDKNNDMIYIIDFGFCCKYNKKNKERSNMIGTPNYVSIRVLEGCEPNRRDDLESLVYIMYYLWKGEISVTDKKKFINRDNEIPEYMLLFFDYCRSLEYDEEPKYDYLYSLLKKF